MCGITGFVSLDPQPWRHRESLRQIADDMADSMRKRGPDDRGTWVDAAHGVGLGFRRLAIVDLTPAGHQPMVSANGRYVIVFNGEIYNHRALRQSLRDEGISFRGTSDTEVLLAGVERWGLEATLQQAVGMFAIALWDTRDKAMLFARDRMGEKPLYYGVAGNTLIFGSELKALRAHPDFEPGIDRNALALYFRHSCIPAPHSIYEGIKKLPPGCILAVPVRGKVSTTLPEPRPYWSARAAAHEGQSRLLDLDDSLATDELERLIAQSIANQMVADVPVGAFLSGGIDSSTIVALMQTLSGRPINTFSIGFHELGFDEATHARSVARHLGTNHTELYVTAEQAQSVIPGLPDIYDEPFSDSSQIPTFLLSQLARQDVTVSLSGDGGDELFGGYSRYALSENMWRYTSVVPRVLRDRIGRSISRQPAEALDRRFWFLDPILRNYGARGPVSTKLFRIARVLNHGSFQDLYRDVMSHWNESDNVVPGAGEAYSVLADPDSAHGLTDVARQMRYFDQVGYLPDDILAKVDRAAMGASLETRIPLLDHRIVEFAWRLPAHLLRRGKQSKWLLRQVLYRHVPRGLIERPKMGFGVPIGAWLRGPLRDWAEELLDPRNLNEGDYLNADIVQRRWQQHTSAQRNWQHHLWAILMFQAWKMHLAQPSPALHRAA